MKNWHRFRKLGRRIVKNGWYLTELWKAYKEFQKKDLFSKKNYSRDQFNAVETAQSQIKKDGTARASRTCTRNDDQLYSKRSHTYYKMCI